MATFQGDLDEQYELSVRPGDALVFFADLGEIEKHSPEIRQATRRGEDTLDIVLKDQQSGTTTFTGRYACRWTADPASRTLRWQTVPTAGENMRIRGEARFEGPETGPTRIRWKEHVEADVPVNRLLATAIRPVADRLMLRGMRGYVERMIAALQARR